MTTPSSRSQKIAQAKWEFLFGRQTEESCSTTGTVGHLCSVYLSSHFGNRISDCLKQMVLTVKHGVLEKSFHRQHSAYLNNRCVGENSS